MTENKGQFKKGVSGNTKGRPSKKKQAENLIKKLDIKEEFDGKDSQDTLEKLLSFYNLKFDNSSDLNEQVQYAKLMSDISNKLISFQKSRFSSVDSEENKITEMVVSWGTPEEADRDHPMYAAKKKFNPESE